MDLERLDHFVVLMLENRSFDAMLGYLYSPDEMPGFDGVAGRDLSNPIPAWANSAERGSVPVEPGSDMEGPYPDPGEEYPHVNAQLFGEIVPQANAGKRVRAMQPPYNVPQPPPAAPPMTGFVLDYIVNFWTLERRNPTFDEYRIIMNCYTPDAVPVLSSLAREFAVCDRWFCEVPSQTFPNRSFLHTGTSSGFVINEPYAQFPRRNVAETLFDRLSSRRLTWKIYYDRTDHSSLTELLHHPRLHRYAKTNIVEMERFFDDAREGTLPNYAFVEPRLFFNHNDMHPPAKVAGFISQSSVLAGEQLVAQVYDALRSARSPMGSSWRNTALIITFDEHGGCFDHVPPPAAVPPDPAAPAGQLGFRFDRLGVRVPAIVVSPYTERRTVVHAQLQHTSILRTVCDRWGLGHFTERDRHATPIVDAFNRDELRPPEDWPVVTPRQVSGASSAITERAPLNHLQQGVVGLTRSLRAPDDDEHRHVRTVGQALRFLRRHRATSETAR